MQGNLKRCFWLRAASLVLALLVFMPTRHVFAENGVIPVNQEDDTSSGGAASVVDDSFNTVLGGPLRGPEDQDQGDDLDPSARHTVTIVPSATITLVSQESQTVDDGAAVTLRWDGNDQMSLAGTTLKIGSDTGTIEASSERHGNAGQRFFDVEVGGKSYSIENNGSSYSLAIESVQSDVTLTLAEKYSVMASTDNTGKCTIQTPDQLVSVGDTATVSWSATSEYAMVNLYIGNDVGRINKGETTANVGGETYAISKSGDQYSISLPNVRAVSSVVVIMTAQDYSSQDEVHTAFGSGTYRFSLKRNADNTVTFSYNMSNTHGSYGTAIHYLVRAAQPYYYSTANAAPTGGEGPLQIGNVGRRHATADEVWGNSDWTNGSKDLMYYLETGRERDLKPSRMPGTNATLIYPHTYHNTLSGSISFPDDGKPVMLEMLEGCGDL